MRRWAAVGEWGGLSNQRDKGLGCALSQAATDRTRTGPTTLRAVPRADERQDIVDARDEGGPARGSTPARSGSRHTWSSAHTVPSELLPTHTSEPSSETERRINDLRADGVFATHSLPRVSGYPPFRVPLRMRMMRGRPKVKHRSRGSHYLRVRQAGTINRRPGTVTVRHFRPPIPGNFHPPLTLLVFFILLAVRHHISGEASGTRRSASANLKACGRKAAVTYLELF